MLFPVETTRLTDELGATCVPAAGDVEITSPFGTEVLGWEVVVPTASPATPSLLEAWASERPVTFGTVIFAGPLDTVSTTVDPLGAALSGPGDWLTTVPWLALAFW